MSVLLFTTMPWPFPAQLAGAFAGCGIAVEALAPPHVKLAHSRHVTRQHAWQLWAPRTALERALKAGAFNLVVPCDDIAAEILLARQNRTPLSRVAFAARAAAAGAPVAETVALNSVDDLNDAIARLGLPLVIKSDATWGGDGVAIVRDREQAREAFAKFSSGSRLRNLARAARRKRAYFLSRALFPVAAQISAQRFVEGAPATSTLACWQGTVLAAHHFDVVQCFGSTGPASVIAHADCAKMQAAAVAVAKAFNLSGLVGLDYIRDADGQVHLLEINARAVPTSHLALHQDLVFALAAAAGLGPRPRAATTDQAHIALFPREWLRDPSSPWLKTAYHDVPWDDPAVVRACAEWAPPSVRAVLEAGAAGTLAAKTTLFRA